MKLNQLELIYCSRFCVNFCSTEPIHQITTSPGIYFDPSSVAYFYNDYWNVVTYLNILSFKPYLTKIEKSLFNLNDFCEKAQNLAFIDINCKDSINPLEILISSSYLKYDSLSHLISDKRSKRSIEFGGEILKFFFGTLDADDARKYDEAISICQENEKEIFNLMKNNIHIVKSTIGNFNASILKLNNNEIRLNNQIEKLNYIFQENSKINTKIINVEKINSILNIIEASLLSVTNILDAILNSILFAKANILHPFVLSPSKLFEELSNSKITSKKTVEFPLMLSLENIHTIIDLSELTTYYYNSKLVFILKIPLINLTKFSIYKNLPLPTPHELNNYQTYVLIKPTKQYIAVTDDRLLYALLDNIDSCKNVNYDYIICPLPSVLSTINNPSCESKLLSEVTLSLPDICESKVIYGNINVWQKLKNDNYIYVQSKPNKLTIKCNNNIKDFTLQGTGILKLKENCTAYFQTLTFEPSFSLKTVLPSQLFVEFNILEDDCCKMKLYNKTSTLLPKLSITNIDLDSLNLASHKLDHLENEIDKIENQPHIVKYGIYYSTLTYVILTCMFLYLCYKIYKNCLRKESTASCCIQIFNQCNNKKIKRTEANSSTAINLSEIKEYDSRSLPEIEINKEKVFFRSNRNIDNF